MNQNKFPIECEECEKIDRLTFQKDYGGLLAYLKFFEGQGRIFSVGDIRQSQEWHCGNRAKSDELPLDDYSPGPRYARRRRECRGTTPKESYRPTNSSVTPGRVDYTDFSAVSIFILQIKKEAII